MPVIQIWCGVCRDSGTMRILDLEVKSQSTSFKPVKRGSHTATLINDKLYILGGHNVSADPSGMTGKQFFYLDVSVSFSIKDVKWVNLTSNNSVPPHFRASAVKGGANNKTLFLYGGEPINEQIEQMEVVYTFDTQGNSWSIPKITGIYSVRKKSLFPVVDNNGKMFLFGGFTFAIFNVNDYVNDMTILDTINLRWEQGSSINAPTPRGYYGATLLPDQKIIYIGGYTSDQPLSLEQVYLYDTMNDEWSTQSTSGKIPSNRDSFSAVLGLDGQRVIIYGGTNISNSDALYELNVKGWEWRIPKVQSDIYLLDISNIDEYQWTNLYTPSDSLISSPSTTTKSMTSSTAINENAVAPKETNNNSPNTMNVVVLVGAILGTLAFGILLSVGGFLLCSKRRRKTQVYQVAIPTPRETKSVS
ncbi:11826_t:CDS:2 [Funneliformis caledonium]|uniref:11826_t:CDS:1 n=1 Tax=Funneliformis caledonium TaxID=1117310 RepID=A0A9N9HC52_9GLOM|nr:11826_t:CDS:2 [Funneliformis caledonium]